MSETYHGLIISPCPYQLKDGIRWKVAVYIAQDISGETVDTFFNINKVFESKVDALSAGFEFGRHQADKLIHAAEIEGVRNQAMQLPSTHAHGLGHNSDDIAVGDGGQPTN